MTEHIFFCTHNPSGYKTEKWRSSFSQWYPKTFQGQIDLSDFDFLTENDLVLINKTYFKCREQWMMFLKAILFTNLLSDQTQIEHNQTVMKTILSTTNPAQMKKLGRSIKGFDEDIWQKWRYSIVLKGNLLQFTQDPELQKILLATGDKIIVEAAWYDRIWGIGFREKDALQNKDKWGLNLLGKALMEVREILNQ